MIGGIVAVFVIASLWEARDYLTAQDPTEADLSTLVGGLTNSKPQTRKYYLSAKVRLEIVVCFVVIICCAFIGAI